VEGPPHFFRAARQVRSVEHVGHRAVDGGHANVAPAPVVLLDPCLAAVGSEQRGSGPDRDESSPPE
jgi:hypothetical protein